MFRVYRIKNKINNKNYIGITSRSIEERFNEHISRASCNHRNSRLYAAIRKYGVDSFILTEIDKSDNEDAVRKLEEKYIRKFDSYENGYNCNYGGHGFLVFPDEIKKKISETQIGKYIPIETRKKMSLAKLGDKRCAKHFGDYTKKGKNNPKSKFFLIQFPDGHTDIINGIRAFCRKHDLQHSKLSARGKTKGFVLLRRFTDHPEREYAQVSGSGAHPKKGEDMVGSAWQYAAVHKRTNII